MPEVASTWIKRGLILVGLFCILIPGWIAGVYLILKWTGLIRGLSRKNELAAGWALVSLVVAIGGLALFASIVRLGEAPAQVAAGDELRPLAIVLGSATTVGTFLLVRTYGAPQITKSADWRGFWIGVFIAVAGVSISAGSYDAARGGGTYVLAWGAVVAGGLMALRSLRRPDGAK